MRFRARRAPVRFGLSDTPENTAITRERMGAAEPHLWRRDIAILKTCWDERASIDAPELWTRSLVVSAPHVPSNHAAGYGATAKVPSSTHTVLSARLRS